MRVTLNELAAINVATDKLDAIASDLADAVATAAGGACDAVFVGPASEISDHDGAFGVHILLCASPARFLVANCVAAGSKVSSEFKRRCRGAIVAALCARFHRVELFNSVRALLDAAEALNLATAARQLH